MHRRAFTLIELLVTITIIGLLTGLSAVAFVTAQANSRDTARRTTLSALASAVEQYRTSQRRYPGITNPVASNNCVNTNTYYYSPVANGCAPHDLMSVTGLPDSSGAFNPPPTWIPGIGSYMSPAAMEARFLLASGTSPVMNSDGSPQNARTFSYQRTATGYSLYTFTERTPCGGNVCSIKR
jgi:prepilin-type N-terminal cleavage/methylation domain-containing protein